MIAMNCCVCGDVEIAYYWDWWDKGLHRVGYCDDCAGQLMELGITGFVPVDGGEL